MISAFGKAVRKHRIDQSMTLKDMASTLGVQPSYLSAVEHGRKNATQALARRVATALGLDPAAENELLQLTGNTVKIDLSRASERTCELARLFARKYASLSDEETAQMMEIIGTT